MSAKEGEKALTNAFNSSKNKEKFKFNLVKFIYQKEFEHMFTDSDKNNKKNKKKIQTQKQHRKDILDEIKKFAKEVYDKEQAKLKE